MDQVEKALMLFETLPENKQLELILSMHNIAPEVIKDNWFKLYLDSQSSDMYSEVAAKIIEAHGNEEVLTTRILVDILMQTSSVSTPASVSTTSAASSVSTGSSQNDSPKQSGTKRDFCFSQNPLPGGQDSSLKRTSLSTNYGAKVLNKESETADEFEKGAAAFIVRVDTRDATIGCNTSYVLVSILNYVEKDYDILER
jgi:hypothetical protein